MPVMVLAFGICALGCAVTPNFYNLGNVSEENCALVQVSPVWTTSENEYQVINWLKIDGQVDTVKWQRPITLFPTSEKAIVRITPDVHTFTVTFIRSNQDPLSNREFRENIPVSITYDCKAGKGYYVKFSGKTIYSILRSGVLFPVAVEITLFECDVNKNGNFGPLVTEMTGREVSKKTEIIDRTGSEPLPTLEGYR